MCIDKDGNVISLEQANEDLSSDNSLDGFFARMTERITSFFSLISSLITTWYMRIIAMFMPEYF
ncbi:MAG: hypothetical protein IK085_07585 [Clostridia bacterium]|nr:hypothetical protein [Clostridia bacterium]